MQPERAASLAAELVSASTAAGWTVAVAESLTAGLVTATLASVPGASAVLRGGVTAYATDLKTTLLGVPEPLLTEHGAVSRETASAMAVGVRKRCDATYGLATTGVAGPDTVEGHPVGLVYVAVSSEYADEVHMLRLDGTRDDVRWGAVVGVLELWSSMRRV